MEHSVVSIDLMQAARRSESFPKDWTEEMTRTAITHYEKFLMLVARDPHRPVAPTREIDVIWHLHMLSPRAYYQDCQRLFGMILDHDGGFGTETHEIPILKATFEETARLWEEAYGEPYVPGAASEGATKCWHDCSGRCWHACSSVQAAGDEAASIQ